MPRNDAVSAVTGEIFREGWSRIRGSMQGLDTRRQRQLVRAAAGHRPAVFKAIQGGGTFSKAQLASQLEYLTTKSSHIVDSSGFLDGKAQLEGKEITSLTERFAKRWEAGTNLKLGQTTHLLMSFPIGTRGEDVRDIASDVAERFFQTEAGHFDYIIAVHEDRDHPHAHLVLNRRSQEGETFYLGRDHRFNYDDFRLAMVEAAERYGVRLEATRRLERGEVHYPARTREVYAAKEEGRDPAPRARVGADLIRALAEIANTRAVYQSLAAEASRDNRSDIADALFRAGEMLARGGRLDLKGDVYMAEEQSFDDLKSRYVEQVARIQGMIAEKPEAERPRLEKSLNVIQARLAHMQPLGLRSMTLTERPSEGGVYSEANIDAAHLDRLRAPEVRTEVEIALKGTGISSSMVIARMEAGAPNAALERQWIADDLKQVATRDGLNLERRADLERAREVLNRAHVALGQALERAGVLRQDGVEEESVTERFHFHAEAVEDASAAIRREMRLEGLTDDEIEDRDGEVIARAERRIEAEQRAWLAGHPEILQSPGEVIDRSQPYREHITDEGRAGEIAREVDRLLAARGDRVPMPVTEAVAEHFRTRYPDMPAHLARGLGATYSAVVEVKDNEAINEIRRERELREALGTSSGTGDAPQGIDADRRAREMRTDHLSPEIQRTITQGREGDRSEPFADARERDSFRAAVERGLDAGQLDRLRAGDADVLKDRIGDRLDRLHVAKVWLQSDAATANSDATRAVVEEIAEREYERDRLGLNDGESERGEVH